MKITCKISSVFIVLFIVGMLSSCGGGGGNGDSSTFAGILDDTFGISGVAIYDSGGLDEGRSIALQSDGKAIVAGISDNGTDWDFLLMRYNTSGMLDTTFGTDGVVTYDGGNSDMAFSVAIQTDGKVLVAGASNNGTDHDLVLRRYNNNGALDTTFGVSGMATYDGGNSDRGWSVAIQSDDKALVAGRSFNGTDDDFVLLRYNTVGTLDTTFGTDGVARYDGLDGRDGGHSVAIQSDGKILVAGESEWSDMDLILARFNVYGTLDTTFGTSGIVKYDDGFDDRGWSVVIQPDGKALVAGRSNNGTGDDLVLLRCDTAGTLDTTFGIDGVAKYDGGFEDRGWSVAIQSDGKALVGGKSNNGTDDDLALLRYNIAGALDKALGVSGIVTYDGGFDDYGYSVAVQVDGKVLVVGKSNNGTDDDLVLLRYK